MRLTAGTILLYMTIMVSCPVMKVFSCPQIDTSCTTEQCDFPEEEKPEAPCADCVCGDCCNMDYISAAKFEQSEPIEAEPNQRSFERQSVSEFHSSIWNPPDMS